MMRYIPSFTAIALATTLASAAAAQAPTTDTTVRRVELGIDAGAQFGFGDRSSVSITLPGSRFRVGFFRPGSRVSIEPALGFGYNKVKGTDGVFTYDLQLGALYHFQPIIVDDGSTSAVVTRVTPVYVRPFVGVTGFSGGNTSDHEFSLGVGLGTKIPWRRNLATRLETNVGYGFSNKAARVGLLAGLSYFPR